MEKKYPIATEKYSKVVTYTLTMEKTNCTDKKAGHQYRWIQKDDPIHDEILAEHPSFRGIGIVQCTKCKKVAASM